MKTTRPKNVLRQPRWLMQIRAACGMIGRWKTLAGLRSDSEQLTEWFAASRMRMQTKSKRTLSECCAKQKGSSLLLLLLMCAQRVAAAGGNWKHQRLLVAAAGTEKQDCHAMQWFVPGVSGQRRLGQHLHQGLARCCIDLSFFFLRRELCPAFGH